MKISLPDTLGKWVKALDARERMDALPLESLESGPSTPMTANDWQDIREIGKQRFIERRKKSR